MSWRLGQDDTYDSTHTVVACVVSAQHVPLEGVTITTDSLPSGMTKVRYSAMLAASGGKLPYKWSVSSGALPKGLHLKKSTGVISGRPNKDDSGTYTFTVKVVDKAKNSSTEVLSITIS